MTENEGTFTFDLMNLRFTFFKNEHGTWYLRIEDTDAVEAGVAGLQVEQRLDQSFDALRMMATMAGLVLGNDTKGEPTNQALDPV